MTEHEQLERELAYSAAREAIHRYAFMQRYGDGSNAVWWRVSREYISADALGDVTMAVRYLELIGKLTRHPERPELVRVEGL